MQRKFTLIILSAVFLNACLLFKTAFSAEENKPALLTPVTKNDRIMIISPHPDDEAIACAGIIQEAVAKGAQVRVVYLTNGDHNQLALIVYEKRLTLRQGEFIHMGRVRQQEAIDAMKLLGVGKENLIFLGYPDFGTFSIFTRYWQSKKPFRSMLTRISEVPYKENFSFGAPYEPESILRDLEAIIADYKPNKIFVSHPGDTNVDHKALYLFLQIALLDLQDKIPAPKVYPYLVHCLGWPLPRHYHPELSLNPPRQFQGSSINWVKFELTPEQLEKKNRAILCYRSQTRTSAFYLLSFARKNELFGDYPEVELEKQVSLKEQAVSFFGFSYLFKDFGRDDLGEQNAQDFGNNKDRVSYAVVDNSVFVRIEKSVESKRRPMVQLYLFGYSPKVTFALMPKIRIVARGSKIDVYNQNTKIKSDTVSSEMTPKIFTIKVPLGLLGNPDIVITSIRSFGDVLSMDVTGFRKLVIKEGGRNAGS